MRPSVLFVTFFVLLVVFSAYAVAYTQGLPTQSVSRVSVGTYSLQGKYDYLAVLRPNQVYNSSTLRFGQGTLFVAITKSINLTYTCTVSQSQPGDASLNVSYVVLLSGGAWNKTLATSSQSIQRSGATSTSISKSFFLNMTKIESNAKEIGSELQYSSQNYVVEVIPVVTGSVSEKQVTVPLNLLSPLNLTISKEVISASGTDYVHEGNFTAVSLATNTTTFAYRNAAYTGMAGSLTLLALSSYYVLRVEKKGKPVRKDELAILMAPYAEVIAATTSLPKGETRIVMEKWEDLVKVADTLGKPILKFADRGEGFTRYLFWVLDGETTYLYEATSKPNWAA